MCFVAKGCTGANSGNKNGIGNLKIDAILNGVLLLRLSPSRDVHPFVRVGSSLSTVRRCRHPLIDTRPCRPFCGPY